MNALGCDLEERELESLPFAWFKGWIGPWEATYTLLLKYAWANVLSAGEIARHVLGVALQSPPYATQTMLSPHWIDDRRLRRDLLPVREIRRGFLAELAPHWAFALASSVDFRFCPVCLRHGYQSMFHQLTGLERCPIDGERLTEQCASCGTRTGAYALRLTAFRKPFHCTTCGKSLAGGEFEFEGLCETAHLHALASRAFRPFALWLRRLERSPYRWGVRSRRAIGWLYHEQNLLSGCRSELTAFDVAVRLGHLPDGCLDFTDRTRRWGRQRTLHIRPLHYAILDRNQWSRLVPEREARSFAIYRSVRRYIEQHVVPRHRACLHRMAYALYSPNVEGVFEVPRHFCPFALAFCFWIVTCQSRLPDMFSRPLVTIAGDRWGVLSDLEGKLMAWELLSAFYRCTTEAAKYASEHDRLQLPHQGQWWWPKQPAGEPGFESDLLVFPTEISEARKSTAVEIFCASESLANDLESVGADKCAEFWQQPCSRYHRPLLVRAKDAHWPRFPMHVRLARARA